MAPKFIIEKSKASFVRVNNQNNSKLEKDAALALLALSRGSDIPPVSNIPQMFLRNDKSVQTDSNYQIVFKDYVNKKQYLESNINLQLQNKKLKEDLDKFRRLFKNEDRSIIYKLIERLDGKKQ